MNGDDQGQTPAEDPMKMKPDEGGDMGAMPPAGGEVPEGGEMPKEDKPGAPTE